VAIHPQLPGLVHVSWPRRATPSPVSRPLAPRGVNSATKKGGPYSTSRENILNLAINKSNEIYGACRHKPKFHRFTRRQNDASTDETEKVERVTGRPNSTTSQASTSSTATFESCDKRGEDVLPIQDLALTLGIKINKKHGLEARF
jgi:hypothetical protein